MSKISIITLFQNPKWRLAVRSINGEAPHRLHNILLFKFNETGRYYNRITCDPNELTELMGYKNTSAFKKARRTLTQLGIWDYHKNATYNQSGRLQGYFSVPSEFLQGADMAPSETPSSSKDKDSQGADMAPSKGLQGADMAPSETPSSSKDKDSQGADMAPTHGSNTTPYTIDSIVRYIDDDDVALKSIIQKFVKAGKPFAYVGKTAQLQAVQLTTLVKKARVNKLDLDKAVQLIIDKPNIKDAPNYLIATIKRMLEKQIKKPRKYKPAKKRVFKGTDWEEYSKKHKQKELTDEQKKLIEEYFGPKKEKENNKDSKKEKDDKKEQNKDQNERSEKEISEYVDKLIEDIKDDLYF